MRLRIYEVPVSYHGRTYDEGKKIGWKDGVRALYCIVKYGVRRSPARPARPQLPYRKPCHPGSPIAGDPVGGFRRGGV